LEELLGEISSLASVYHKPEETFVGRGRVGAEAVQRKAESVIYNFSGSMSEFLIAQFLSCRLGDDRFSTQRAIQTVAAGQQAENLLLVSFFFFHFEMQI
jgi:hypothetical protein